jgi:heme A synthase
MLSVGVFRRLAFVTALFAYLQIALGGVVRVSGSGLGCPDWPLCNGRPYPPANVHSIIEYSHRLVGSITELLIVITVVAAWIVFRRSRPAVAWLATAALAAGLSEALLGGIVVENELAPWMVLFHLGLAMIILGLLVATAIMSLPATQGTPRRTLWVAAAATYLLVLTGSTVVASRADESCHAWPACGNGFALSRCCTAGRCS